MTIVSCGCLRLPAVARHLCHGHGRPCLCFVQEASKDSRLFPGHAEVLRYLQAYAQHFDLCQHIRLQTRVTAAESIETPFGGFRWHVEWQTHATRHGLPMEAEGTSNGSGNGSALSGPGAHQYAQNGFAHPQSDGQQSQQAASSSSQSKVFDALVICNGHYAVPRVPPIDGLDTFSARCEHSHNYRRPDAYAGQRVVTVGAHASGVLSVHRLHAQCTGCTCVHQCGIE